MPTLVNPPDDFAAFDPAITVNTRAQVGVTFCDFRQLAKQPGVLPTDYWLGVTAGPGVDFSHSYTHVSGPFNVEAAPFSGGGYFLGITRGSRSAATACTTTRCAAVGSPTADPLPPGTPDPMDVYSSKLYTG